MTLHTRYVQSRLLTNHPLNRVTQALRITRGDALKGVIGAVEQQKNIRIECGKRAVKIVETEKDVTLHFEDGTTAIGDMLLGCDGIHSATRLKHVEPERRAVYSGICNAFGFCPRPKDAELHFECTGINFGRRGMLLTSFFESTQSLIYVGALMQKPEIGSRDGWKAAGAESEQIQANLADRFSGSAMPIIPKLIEGARDFYLWPVFSLSKGGKWSTNRTMLMGDAAHAMPPQGESTAIVFEDTVFFSRCLTEWIRRGQPGAEGMKLPFEAYEKMRRPRIDSAFEESKEVVKVVLDAGWVGHKIKTFVIPWFMWWTRANREKHFIEDVTTSDLGELGF